MSNEFPSDSTYRAPFDISDRNGEPLDVSNASVQFVLSERRGRGEIVFEATDDNREVDIHPEEITGRVEVTVPASDVPTGVVFEELRVTLDESLVVSQRSVSFTPTVTEP